MTHTEHVLKLLKRGRRLTPLEALREVGTMRLGARCYELKQQGHPIKSVKVKRGNAWVAEYSYG